MSGFNEKLKSIRKYLDDGWKLRLELSLGRDAKPKESTKPTITVSVAVSCAGWFPIEHGGDMQDHKDEYQGCDGCECDGEAGVELIDAFSFLRKASWVSRRVTIRRTKEDAVNRIVNSLSSALYGETGKLRVTVKELDTTAKFNAKHENRFAPSWERIYTISAVSPPKEGGTLCWSPGFKKS